MHAEDSAGEFKDLLLALLGFYAALSTVFIPLTFALIAQLKDQYRETLDKKALASHHALIFRFQRAFFSYNDLLSQVVVYVSISGVVVSGWVYVFHFSETLSAHAPSPSALLAFAIPFHIGVWLYIWRISHKELWGTQFGPNPRKVLIAEFKKLDREDKPRCNGWHWMAIGGGTLLFVWLAPILAVSFERNGTSVEALRLTSGFLALNAAFLIALWWDFYVSWQPFSFLKDVEALPDSPDFCLNFLRSFPVSAIAEVHEREASAYTADLKKLRDRWRGKLSPEEGYSISLGFELQSRTYREFMPQYEDDDRLRISPEEGWTGLQNRLLAAPPEAQGSYNKEGPDPELSKRLHNWALQVADRLRLSEGSTPAVPIFYIGSGYCSLAVSIVGLATQALSNAGVKAPALVLYLIDPITPLGKAREANDPMELEKLARLAGLSPNVTKRLFRCDIHTFLRVWLGDTILPASTAREQEEARIRAAYGAVMEGFIPPLVVMMNNTFGDLVDPTPPGPPSFGGVDKETDLPRALLDLSRQSGRELIRLLSSALGPIGFLMLVHVKKSGEIPPDGAFPYNEERWIRLAGTDPHAGIFFLGRWKTDAHPFVMLARWPSKKQLRDDLARGVAEASKNGSWTFQADQAVADFRPFGGAQGDWENLLWLAYVSPKRSPWADQDPLLLGDYNVAAESDLLEGLVGPGVRAAFAQTAPPNLLVDIGCGDGKLAEGVFNVLSAANRPFDYFPLDVGDAAMRLAQQRMATAGARPPLGEPGSSLPVRFDEAARLVQESTYGGIFILLWNVLHHQDGENLECTRHFLELCRDSKKPIWIAVSVFAEPANGWSIDRGPVETGLLWKMLRGEAPRATSFCAGSRWLRQEGDDLVRLLGAEFAGVCRDVSKSEIKAAYKLESTHDCFNRRIGLVVNRAARDFESSRYSKTKSPDSQGEQPRASEGLQVPASEELPESITTRFERPIGGVVESDQSRAPE